MKKVMYYTSRILLLLILAPAQLLLMGAGAYVVGTSLTADTITVTSRDQTTSISILIPGSSSISATGSLGLRAGQNDAGAGSILNLTGGPATAGAAAGGSAQLVGGTGYTVDAGAVDGGAGTGGAGGSSGIFGGSGGRGAAGGESGVAFVRGGAALGLGANGGSVRIAGGASNAGGDGGAVEICSTATEAFCSRVEIGTRSSLTIIGGSLVIPDCPDAGVGTACSTNGMICKIGAGGIWACNGSTWAGL